ncbi:glycosyltransferase [Plastoroseomonas arctica]|uniref:Glycosyltransferase n=1 Tax=Plastoroseomonas arctica TaxID=1509237 RepID=A0AAF1KM26_9PROT|nr:glycosyltransferase [Plastoroseomonas arctica]MBR0655631.1 glycosyltransferase [Plastoroseomonas arctica]
MTTPPGDPERRAQAWALMREGRHRAALALAQSAPLPTSTLAALAGLMVIHGGLEEAIALLRPVIADAPGPGLVAPFIEAGLTVFRRSINDGADLALLAALAEAAIACPAALQPGHRRELIRLLESHALGHRIPRLAASCPPAERAALFDAPPEAGALTARGLALAAGGRFGRARAAFEAALAVAPQDVAAGLNAGFAALADGDVGAAREAFAAIAPADEAMMAQVAWPRAGTTPWPWAPMPPAMRAGFEALLPAGAEWPRIGLVTPSLNQGDTLEATIRSVARQDYPNLHYVVLDAGSSDASRAVIARHAASIDIAVLEPDRGQVDALNKGFARTEGTLLGWLNADDMLAPGALFALALASLGDPGADIIHGACLVARDGGLVGLQVPLADGRGFDAAGLADIHGRWLRGAYFLQPETLFTRRLLDRVGGLDPGLHFTPDYALWLRAATLGARVAGTAWPSAIYRLHPAQKTAARRAMLAEQVAVRDRLAPLSLPDPAPALLAALASAPLRLLLMPHPAEPHAIADEAAAEAVAALAADGIALRVDAEAQSARDADLVLRMTRAHDGPAWVQAIRDAGFIGPVIAWLVEDWRDPIAHAEIAAAADLLLPSTAAAAPFLTNPHAAVLPALALPIMGVGPREAARRLATAGRRMGHIAPDAWLDDASRFGARLAARAALIGAEDPPGSVYEALLAGQVPVVAESLETGLPATVEASLPVVRHAGDATRALALAEAGFEAAGAARRHGYAAQHHTLAPRLRNLVARLRAMAGG